MRKIFFKGTDYIKLQYKIIAVFVITVIVPMLTINLFTSYIYEKNLKNSTNEISQLLSAQIESNIDTYLNNINQVSTYPYYDKWFQQQIKSITLGQNKEYQKDLDANERMSNFLFNMMIQNKYIRSIFISDLNGGIIYAKTNGGALQPELDYFKPYIETIEGEFRLIETHKQSYLKHSNSQVFSYVRVIKDVNNNTPVGYAIIEIKIEAINVLLNTIQHNKEYIATYLADGSLLHTNIPEEEKDYFFTLYKKITAKKELLPATLKTSGRTYLVSSSADSQYGLTTVIYRDEKKVLSSLNQISNLAQLLTIGILLYVLVNTFYSSKKLTKPLVSLAEAMKKVENGDFKVNVPKKNEDEIGQLTDCFNTMITKIDDLVTNEYKMELQEKESEIKALQNQINPHFLYNTLESIAMMAEINEDPEVADMVSDLGSFFRFVVSGTSNQIHLGAELEYVETYVRIQNVRFHNRINLLINCKEEFLNVEIIKLCIQPLVENCVLHGYKQASEIKIEIHAFKVENIVENTLRNTLRIEVIDFGKGMDASNLTQIRKNVAQEAAATGQSIGLRNVHQRLKLKYGTSSGLHFESALEKGMHVWFEIPL